MTKVHSKSHSEAVQEAYFAVLAAVNRSEKVTEDRRQKIAQLVFEIAADRPPLKEDGDLDVRQLTIDVMCSLLHYFAYESRFDAGAKAAGHGKQPA